MLLLLLLGLFMFLGMFNFHFFVAVHVVGSNIVEGIALHDGFVVGCLLRVFWYCGLVCVNVK